MPSAAERQKAFFEEHGFVVVDLLSPEELSACQAEVRRLHVVAAGEQESTSPSSFQREPFAEGQLDVEGLPVLRKVEGTGELSVVFYGLAQHPKVVETWQNLIGDRDLLLFRSTLMLKPAHHGSAHALHQDSAYWPLRPAGSAIAVSIALTDADASNGCFRVIPGSHKWGLKYWGNITRKPGEDIVTPQAPTDEATLKLSGIDGNGVDKGDVLNSPTPEMLAQQIEVPLRAGQALFFHSLTAHGSDANTSARPRNTALYAAFSPKAEYTAEGSHVYRVIAGLGGPGTEHTMVSSSDARDEAGGASARL